MFTVTQRRKSVNPRLTANSCSALAQPLIEQLQIKKPRFHIWADHGLSSVLAEQRCGETLIIGTNPHVFLSRPSNPTFDELVSTIAHELIHCWQYTTQICCNGATFDDQSCEIQAYSLEPLATVALAASWLSEELLAKQEEKIA